MRLWSIHPKYLDTPGLNGLWREGLGARTSLARRLRGIRRGYASHSQLERFLAAEDPTSALELYLHFVCGEANVERGFNYDSTKLRPLRDLQQDNPLVVSRGQLNHEFKVLQRKRHERGTGPLIRPRRVEPHPIFCAVPGRVAPWEKTRA